MSTFFKVSKFVLPVTAACYIVSAKSACNRNPPLNPPLKEGEMISPKIPSKDTNPHNYTTYEHLPKTFKRYKTTRDFVYDTGIKGFPANYTNPTHGYRIDLDKDGKMTIYAGFLWNGPTACYPFDCTMRGSLVHDAFYELFSKKVNVINRNITKPQADALMREMFKADGCFSGFPEIAEILVGCCSGPFES